MKQTYQIADNNLALSVSSSTLGRNRFGSAAASWLGSLLNAADRGSDFGSSRASLRRTAVTSRLALGRDDVVKGLVELARHFECW